MRRARSRGSTPGLGSSTGLGSNGVVSISSRSSLTSMVTTLWAVTGTSPVVAAAVALATALAAEAGMTVTPGVTSGGLSAPSSKPKRSLDGAGGGSGPPGAEPFDGAAAPASITGTGAVIGSATSRCRRCRRRPRPWR